MTRRILQLLVLAACAALLAAPAVSGQATGATGADPDATVQPTAVEPTAGKPAPAPVDTTPIAPEPVPTSAPTAQATVTKVTVGATGPGGPKGAKATDGGLSNAALAIIAGASLLVLLTGLAAFARWRGWTSRRVAGWRHAAGEANWRMGLRMAEFRDFLRLGR